MVPSAAQQLQRVDPDHGGDVLDGLQGEVALTTLQAAHVRAMDADQVSKGLLGETMGLSIAAQATPDGPLEVPFHVRPDAARLLLERLQTYK